MTYIVAGKRNNNPFLAIDCKYTDGKKFYYTDKVVKLESCIEETYFCQMGHIHTKCFVCMYDNYLKFKGIKFDFTNKNDILKMIGFINYTIEYTKFPIQDYKENYLFFISKNEVYKYTLHFDFATKKYLNNVQQQTINNDESMTSNSVLLRDFAGIDRVEYCKSIIEVEKMGVIDDLKDRYTMIVSNGIEIDYTSPHKTEYDIIVMELGLEFDELDKTDYKFE